MQPTPQIRNISDLARKHTDVIPELKNGPVYLINRGEMIAVLSSPNEWDRIAGRMAALEEFYETHRIIAEMDAGNEITYEQFKQEAQKILDEVVN